MKLAAHLTFNLSVQLSLCNKNVFPYRLTINILYYLVFMYLLSKYTELYSTLINHNMYVCMCLYIKQYFVRTFFTVKNLPRIFSDMKCVTMQSIK